MTADWTHLPGVGIPFFAISVAVGSVTASCFAARTYTSFAFTKRTRLDYWLALTTFVICVFSQISFSIAIEYGLGVFNEALDVEDSVTALRMTWASQISGIIAIVIGKLSIIDFLDQIRGRHNGRPWLLYTVGWTTIVINAVVVVTILVQCTPVDKLWDDRLAGKCDFREFNRNYSYFQGSHSALCDVILALYPMHLISGLQLSTRMKVGLSCLMGVGLLAAVCSTGKTIMLANLTADEDITFYIARLAFATILEAWIVLLVGCVPPLRPLMKAATKSIGDLNSKWHTTQAHSYRHEQYGRATNATKKSSAGSHGVSEHRVQAFGKLDVDPAPLEEVYRTHNRGKESITDAESLFSEKNPGGHVIVLKTDIDVTYETAFAWKIGYWTGQPA